MIRDKLFPTSPYQGFEPVFDEAQFKEDTHPIFRQVFQQLRPKTIIEVGSWKGGSAIHMAKLCKEFGVEGGEIVCVDTWLGSQEMWADHDPASYWGFSSLNVKHGFPTIYYHFLSNVALSGHSDIITPFPISSVGGAEYLANKNVEADLIYVDGGHGYRDAKNDIEAYWGLLRMGGVMIGDDYHSGAPGVIQAVNEFAASIGQKHQVLVGKWMLQRLPS